MDYKNAGVDIEAGYKSVELMKEHVKRTMRDQKLWEVWADFPEHFPLRTIQRHGRTSTCYPVQTDVGTKVKTCNGNG